MSDKKIVSVYGIIKTALSHRIWSRFEVFEANAKHPLWFLGT